MLTPPAAGTCHYTNQHIEVTLLDPGRLHLIPVCSSLIRSDSAESAGEILGAALSPGSFIIDAPFEYENRLGRIERRGRARWVPDQVVSSDLRVFLLLAAPSEGALPTAAISEVACAPETCFRVDVGAGFVELAFTGQAGAYELVTITEG
jgi:hypothetical protein